MGRFMGGAEDAAYRAVITTMRPADTESGLGESSSTSYAGPYRTKGAARAAITRAKREAGWRQRTWGVRLDAVVTGHVERSSTVWVRLDEMAEHPGP